LGVVQKAQWMIKLEITTKNTRGHVMLHDPLPLIKLANFEEALEAALKIDPKLGKAKAHAALLPSILECVAEWRVDGIPENLTIETYPGIGTNISKVDTGTIINLIVNELIKFFVGKDPNE